MDNNLEIFDSLYSFDFDNSWADPKMSTSKNWNQEISNPLHIKTETAQDAQPWMSKRTRKVITFPDDFTNEKETTRRKIRKRKDKSTSAETKEEKLSQPSEILEDVGQVYGENIENFFLNVSESINESNDSRTFGLLNKYFNENVVIRIRTPSMTREVIGRTRLFEMHEIFSDAFPDLVISHSPLKKGTPSHLLPFTRCEHDSHTGSMVQIHTFNFTGTKALHSPTLEVIGIREGSSLTSLMDPSKHTPEGLASFQQFENECLSSGKLMTLLADCTLKLYLGKSGLDFFLCDVEWSVQNFRGFGKNNKSTVSAALGTPCEHIFSPRLPLSFVWGTPAPPVEPSSSSSEEGMTNVGTKPVVDGPRVGVPVLAPVSFTHSDLSSSSSSSSSSSLSQYQSKVFFENDITSSSSFSSSSSSSSSSCSTSSSSSTTSSTYSSSDDESLKLKILPYQKSSSSSSTSSPFDDTKSFLGGLGLGCLDASIFSFDPSSSLSGFGSGSDDLGGDLDLLDGPESLLVFDEDVPEEGSY